MRVFVLVGLALLNMQTNPVPNPMAPPEKTDCVMAEVNGACSNLLPVEFWTMRNADSLKALSVRIEGMREGAYTVSADRHARWRCRGVRNWRNPKAKSVNLTYSVPKAMSDFPASGTQERQVVAGIFTVNSDSGCFENRYGTRSKEDDWERVVQFQAIRTRPASLNIQEDTNIGSWIVWSIERNQDSTKWRIRDLAAGEFRQCAGRHVNYQEVGAAFRNCEGDRKADQWMNQQIQPMSTGSSSQPLARLRTDKELQQTLGIDTFTDPAWGRCGALGCCVAEQ